MTSTLTIAFEIGYVVTWPSLVLVLALTWTWYSFGLARVWAWFDLDDYLDFDCGLVLLCASLDFGFTLISYGLHIGLTLTLIMAWCWLVIRSSLSWSLTFAWYLLDPKMTLMWPQFNSDLTLDDPIEKIQFVRIWWCWWLLPLICKYIIKIFLTSYNMTTSLQLLYVWISS